ncbi:MAG: sterol desaturase family protein [Deltaproteobacteria bacterium]|nr:sterol desaturase family protein [Deltaproteobacteria bacterium]
MLLDLFDGLPFYLLWPALAAIGVAWFLLVCGGLYFLLHRSAYAETALRFKTQLKPTPAAQVRGEVFDGVLAMSMVMGSVAIAFWCYYHGYNRLYASPTDHPLWYIPLSIFGVFLVMEVFEWAFHWVCHRNALLRKVHGQHHRYGNPTPFGVMADHPVDMFIKASPILWIPFLFPIWDVALIGTFASLNFIYGIYLHAGFDPPWMPSPHSRFLVSAWHHNEHHSSSPEHNFGFFTAFMDILFATRLTPSEKEAERPDYHCTECRNAIQAAPAAAS